MKPLMSEQGNQGFKLNTMIDVGHIITALVLLGGLFTMYRSMGESKVAQIARIEVVERAQAQQEKNLIEITTTLKSLSENQTKVTALLDMQIQRGMENRERIRDLEKSHP